MRRTATLWSCRRNWRALPGRPDYRRGLGLTCNNRGRLLWKTGRLAEAEKVIKQAVDVWRGLENEFPANPGYRLQLARALTTTRIGLRSERPARPRGIIAKCGRS